MRKVEAILLLVMTLLLVLCASVVGEETVTIVMPERTDPYDPQGLAEALASEETEIHIATHIANGKHPTCGYYSLIPDASCEYYLRAKDLTGYVSMQIVDSQGKKVLDVDFIEENRLYLFPLQEGEKYALWINTAPDDTTYTFVLCRDGKHQLSDQIDKVQKVVNLNAAAIDRTKELYEHKCSLCESVLYCVCAKCGQTATRRECESYYLSGNLAMAQDGSGEGWRTFEYYCIMCGEILYYAWFPTIT